MKTFKAKTMLLRTVLTLAVMLCCLTGARAQATQELTVYDGTNTNNCVPVYGLWIDSQGTASEFVIPGDDLADMKGGTISGLKFYLGSHAQEAWTSTFQVYLAEIDETTLTGITGPDACTVVYTGTLDATGSEMTVTFDTPYTYGDGNLLIGTYVSEARNYKTASFYGSNQSGNTAMYRSGASGSGNAQRFIPKTTFTYTPGSGVVYSKPSGLTLDEVGIGTATLSWTAPTEGTVTGYAYQYKKTTEEAWSTEAVVTTTSAALSGLAAGTAYDFRVKAVYADGESRYISTSFYTDCDAITTFPWTEDFEDFSASSSGVKLDYPCWQNEHISGDGSYFFEVWSGTNGSNSTKQLRLHDMSSGTMTKLRLPVMMLPGDNYMFALDVYRNSNYSNYTDEGIRVFASADGEIEGATELAFIPRVSSASSSVIPAESADGWYSYELPIPMSGTCYIILRGESRYGAPTYMDNFTVSVASGCSKPMGLAVSDVTESAATITWNQGEASAWQVCVNDDETNLIDVTSPTCTLTNLNAKTTYSVKVRTKCGENAFSNWSSSISFTTTAVPVAVSDSWSDNFEDGNTSWELINGSCFNRWIWGNQAYTGSGTYALYVSNNSLDNNYNLNNSSTVYAAKLLHFTGGKHIFSYDWRCYGESGSDYMRVALVPGVVELAAGSSLPSGFGSTSLPAGWIALDGGKALNLTNSWKNETRIVEVPDGNYYLVVAWHNDSQNGNNHPAAIDNVSITRMACQTDAENIVATVTSTTSATISWTAVDGQEWQLSYSDNSDFTNATAVSVGESASYTITGLQPHKFYYVRVRAHCGGEDYGLWSEAVKCSGACAVITDYPWTENFDSHEGSTTQYTSTNNLPPCWNYINEWISSSYSGYPIVYRSASSAHSGSNFMLFYSYYTNNPQPQPQYAVLPEMQDLSGKQVKLFARKYYDSYNATFKVGIMTDPTDAATFTEIKACTPTSVDYEAFTILLKDYTGTGTYIAIMIPAADANSGSRGVFIDDITVEDIGACPEPTDLTVTAVTATTATLSWTENGQATSWVVAYKVAADENFTEVNAGTNPFTVEGLTGGTEYTVKVRAVKGTEQSDWSNPASFTTGLVIPLIETFATTSIPTHWNRYQGLLSNVMDGTALSSSTNGWNFNNKNGVFDNHAYVNVYGSSCKYWLVTPTLKIEDNVQLTFNLALTKYSGDDAPAPATTGTDDRFVVLATTDVGTTWTVLREWNNSGSTYVYNAIANSANGEEVTIDLSSYAGQNVAVAFYVESTVQNADNNLHIDNVSIDYAPAFTKPTGLTVSDVGKYQATLSWTENGTATKWQICLNDGEDHFMEVTENPYTLTGLNDETDYTAKVRVYNSAAEYSKWSNTVNFTTPIACEAPTNVAVTALTTTSATLSWTENGTSTAWVVAYKTAAATDFTEVVTNSNPFTIEGLTLETVYVAKVRAVNSDNEYSDWTATVSFEPTEKSVIGSGTTTNSYLPTYTYYKKTVSQQIYTVAELGTAGLIESIDFYSTASERTRNLDIYMVSTGKSSFGDANDWITVTAADRVYSGSVTFVKDAWTSIELTDAFVYDGKNNVAIVVNVDMDNDESSPSFRVFNATAQAIYVYNDYNSYDPTDMTGVTGTVLNVKNQIRILKSPLGDCVKPMRLKATKVSPNQATLSWKENGTATAWVVAYKTGDAAFTEVDVDTNPYILSGLTAETVYTLKVRPACNADLWSNEITITTLANDVVPYELSATGIYADAATLNWTGAQNSYNVRYRTSSPSIIEGFEDADEFANWQVISNNTANDVSSGKLGRNQNAQRNGNYGFSFSSYDNASDYNQYLISPDVSGAKRVEFWYKSYYSSATETFKVGYSSTGTDVENDFTWGSEIKSTSDSEWTQFVLNNLPDGVKYVAINYYSNYQYYLYIDDMTIEVGSAGDWVEKSNVTSPLAIDGLNPETMYEWQVQGIYNESPTAWSDLATFTTKPQPVAITLANNADNTQTIDDNAGVYANITLADRTLSKSGEWNTLCLPFAVSDFSGTPLEGATVKELLTTSNLDINGQLVLNFSADLTAIEAGKPYIVRWGTPASNPGGSISDPVFTGVTITATTPMAVAFTNNANAGGDCQFVGQFSPFSIVANDVASLGTNEGYLDEIILLSTGNKLGYSKSPRTLNCFRAHFYVPSDGGATAARSFILNTGDGETSGIRDITIDDDGRSTVSGVYTLDGRKLDEMPNRKGVYVVNGKKMIIK